jgi:hypothetical protein
MSVPRVFSNNSLQCHNQKDELEVTEEKPIEISLSLHWWLKNSTEAVCEERQKESKERVLNQPSYVLPSGDHLGPLVWSLQMALPMAQQGMGTTGPREGYWDKICARVSGVAEGDSSRRLLSYPKSWVEGLSSGSTSCVGKWTSGGYKLSSGEIEERECSVSSCPIVMV